LKLLADNADYIIFATGSSELRAKTRQFDTLAGRYKEFVLFPLTIDEIAFFMGKTLTSKNRFHLPTAIYCRTIWKKI